MFGNGMGAAAALRARVLKLLGAEPEWIDGEHEHTQMIWKPGLPTTFFFVQPASDETPDLGVLRVETPLVAAEDEAAALKYCATAGELANRWAVVSREDSLGSMQLSCSFVVGPHNVDALTGYAAWCVREQVAQASAALWNDVIGQVNGGNWIFPQFEGRDRRDPEAWNEAVRHLDHLIFPNRDLPSDRLLEEMRGALDCLLRQMRADGTGEWSVSEEHGDGGFLLEMPLSWREYPDGVIAVSGERPPPTASVAVMPVTRPSLGNGLGISLIIPMNLTAVPADEAAAIVNRLNQLDAEQPGTTHGIGGWSMADPGPMYYLFLPAVLADKADVQGINLGFVMREILLTLARQALLARRVLLPPDQHDEEDKGGQVGLGAVYHVRGLAWGETSEGLDAATRVLDEVFYRCVGPDSEWADTRPAGFTWWPAEQAQDITVARRDPGDSRPRRWVNLRIATEVRRNVPATPEALEAIAASNTGLGQSALVLRPDGVLELACRIFIHEANVGWSSQWASALAADQAITARRLMTELAFGDAAVSAHPYSGPRPEPAAILAAREEILVPAAQATKTGLDPIVPLLAIGGQDALAHELAIVGDDGSIDFTWHPSQGAMPAFADPAVRVEVRPGDLGCGPGWIVRSRLPVLGDRAARARWCNDRNLELLGDARVDRHTVTAGWGLTPDGDCCLVTWMTPRFVRDSTEQAAAVLATMLKFHQDIVLASVAADSTSVPDELLTARAFAGGLRTVLASLGQVLEHPAGYQWSVDADDAGAVVSLSGPYDRRRALSAPTSPGGSSVGATVLRVPVSANRAELSLVYAAFLGHSVTRVPTDRDFDLVPGEIPGRSIQGEQFTDMLRRLDTEGLVRPDSEGNGVFEVGSGLARLDCNHLAMSRLYDSYELVLYAIVEDPALNARFPGLPPAPHDQDMIGYWRRMPEGLAYGVVLPPASLVWPDHDPVVDMLTWVGRHIISRVREAFKEGSSNER